MFTLTITGNTPEELSQNLAAMFSTRLYALTADPQQGQAAQPPIANPTQPTVPASPPAAPFAVTPETVQPPIAPPTAPAAPAVPDAAPAPTAPAQNATTPPPATPAANPVPAVPAAAPTYTLDALARAGATLAQSGKMTEALALLARYGVQTVNQLKPEQYGAFATELRALGAQV